VCQRGKGGEGGLGGGEAFDVKPARVGVGCATVAEVEVEGGEGGGVREEVLDDGGGLEVVVAAV
jgi:hypothetical protein